ncbi:MAG: hypothetical protein C4530_23620 [Desulfobacteraceae bacterium]|nr:MAG: hypothetical protein C4530_23620 [Desulfobacteraceae bacterium]
MKLKRRDFGILSLSVFFLMLLLYYFVVISPALSKQRSLGDHMGKKKKDLTEMLALEQEWKSFQEMRREAENILNRRGDGFTLLTYLENVSREVGIETQIQYIKPVSFPLNEGSMQPMGIEMRYNGLDIKQMVNFLHRIEHSKNLLSIKRMKIQPVGGIGSRTLELTLQVDTYTLIK